MSESRRFPWKRVAVNFVARRPERPSKIGKTCLNLIVFLGKELPEILTRSASREYLSKNVNSRFYVGTSDFFPEIQEKLVPKTFSAAVT
jgi:hypothetical protein